MNVWKISGYVVKDAYQNANGFGHFSIDHDQLNYNRSGRVTSSERIRINCEWPFPPKDIFEALKGGVLVIAIGTPWVKKFTRDNGQADASQAMTVRKIVIRPRGGESVNESDIDTDQEETHE